MCGRTDDETSAFGCKRHQVWKQIKIANSALKKDKSNLLISGALVPKNNIYCFVESAQPQMKSSARKLVFAVLFISYFCVGTFALTLSGKVTSPYSNGRLTLQDGICGSVVILTNAQTKFSANGFSLSIPNDVRVVVGGTDCASASLATVRQTQTEKADDIQEKFVLCSHTLALPI